MLSNSISSQFSPIISLQVMADIMMDAQGLMLIILPSTRVWQNCFTMRLFVIKRSGVSAHLVLAVGRCWVSAASNTHGGCKIPMPRLLIWSTWIIHLSQRLSPLSLCVHLSVIMTRRSEFKVINQSVIGAAANPLNQRQTKRIAV